MDAKQHFIYLFRVKADGRVIYVGSCRSLAPRLNEHRRSMREKNREAPIHRYMKENGLRLFSDVEVVIAEFLENSTYEEALKVEEEYYCKYESTLLNTRPAEIRTGMFSPVAVKVRCKNDGREFNSIREASRYYGLDRVTIAAHLNHNTKLKSGLVFERIDLPRNDNSLYRIECDGLKFSTYKACAEYCGIDRQIIYNHFRKGVVEFDYHGKHFKKV